MKEYAAAVFLICCLGDEEIKKKQEHTQQIFREMVSILTEHFDNPDVEPINMVNHSHTGR